MMWIKNLPDQWIIEFDFDKDSKFTVAILPNFTAIKTNRSRGSRDAIRVVNLYWQALPHLNLDSTEDINNFTESHECMVTSFTWSLGRYDTCEKKRSQALHFLQKRANVFTCSLLSLTTAWCSPHFSFIINNNNISSTGTEHNNYRTLHQTWHILQIYKTITCKPVSLFHV